MEFKNKFLVDWFIKNNPNVEILSLINEKEVDGDAYQDKIGNTKISVIEDGIVYSVNIEYLDDVDYSDGGSNCDYKTEIWGIESPKFEKHRWLKPAVVEKASYSNDNKEYFYLKNIEYKTKEEFMNACKPQIIKQRFEQKK